MAAITHGILANGCRNDRRIFARTVKTIEGEKKGQQFPFHYLATHHL